MFVVIAACRGGDRDPHAAAPVDPARAALDATAPSVTADAAPRGAPMATTPDLRDRLPSTFDVRVTRVLEEALPDDVVLALDHVAMAKLPYSNYRFQLRRDGGLYYVQHSGKPGDWQVPFDRPLPTAPDRRLGAAEVERLLDAVEAAGFFGHPGYQANEAAEDGSYWIVRARRGGDVHAVVYQNTQPEPVPLLISVAAPLWKQPG